MSDMATNSARSTPDPAVVVAVTTPSAVADSNSDENSRPPLLNASQPLPIHMWEFLESFRQSYVKNYAKHKGEKGAQINWLRMKVIPGFQERFGLLNRSDIKKIDRACRVRFTRNSDVVASATKASPSRSRYIRRIDWKTALARAKVAEIRARMTKYHPHGSTTKDSNLKLYHRAKGEVVASATVEEIDHYSQVAEQTNRKNTSPPTLSDVHSQQDEVLSILHDQVNDLLGWDVGQLGDVLCFMAVAVRNQDGHIKGDTTFVSNYDVSGDNPHAMALTSNYGKHMHTLFKLVADTILPRHENAEKIPTVMHTKQGHVVFPVVDVEELRLRELRELLRKFIICAWEHSSSIGCPRVKENLPWDELDSPKGREKYLSIYNHFETLTTLNPTNMSAPEVTSVAKKIGGVLNSLVFRKPEASISIAPNTAPSPVPVPVPPPSTNLPSSSSSQDPAIPMPPPSAGSSILPLVSFPGLQHTGLVNGISELPNLVIQSVPRSVNSTPDSRQASLAPPADLSPAPTDKETELTDLQPNQQKEKASTVAPTVPTTEKPDNKRKAAKSSEQPKKKAHAVDLPQVEDTPVGIIRKTTRVAKPRVIPDAAVEPTRKRHGNSSKPAKRTRKV